MNFTDVHLSGPVFDGRAIALTDKVTEEAEKAVAKVAVDRAKAILQSHIKVNVTGAEPNSFHEEKSSFGTVITDNHSIAYGPWLEGTGSRNDSTRFKGYHSVRQATSDVDRVATEIANTAAAPIVKEMN